MKLGDIVFYRNDGINSLGWTVGSIITIRNLINKFNNTKLINYDIDTPYGIIKELNETSIKPIKVIKYDRTTLL